MSSLLKSQVITMSFFDEKGKLTYEETAHYYRQSTDTVNFFRSYYAKNKNKYFEGKILNVVDSLDFNNKYMGLCTWYYLNGKIKVQAEYNETGQAHGVRKEYSEQGYIIKETIYENGKVKNKMHKEFNESGLEINVLEEDFSNNSLDWKLMSTEELNSKIRIGGMEIINKKTDQFINLLNNPIDSANFSIETKVNTYNLNIQKECISGIVFGFKDYSNYNYFYISKQKFHIGFIRDNHITKQIEGYYSVDLKVNNHNKLKILCSNDSLYYYLNNNLQCYSHNEGFIGNKMGFCVNNGYYFFDYLVVKQFSKNSSEPVNGIDQVFIKNGIHKFPFRQINSGVIIGKNGYVLTSIKDVGLFNKYFIEVNSNDTLKLYAAEVYLNNDWSNFTVLKIKDSTIKLPTPIYNIYNYSTVMEKKYVAYNFEEDSTSLVKRNKFYGDINSVIDHKHISYNGIKNNHYCVGSPMFDEKGNILGIITNVNNENEIKSVGMRKVIDALFTNPESNEVKPKKDFDFSNFEKNIYKNLVLVKTL